MTQRHTLKHVYINTHIKHSFCLHKLQIQFKLQKKLNKLKEAFQKISVGLEISQRNTLTYIENV